jgi:predicted phosphoribosyltransferase
VLFRDRDDAGEKLADVLQNLRGSRPIVLGISPGGLVVARHVADRLAAPLALLGEDFAATDAAREASGRTVLLVDDGVCTGATLLHACELVAPAGPREIVAAVPVAPPGWTPGRAAADLYCVARPSPFFAVAQWYLDLPEVGVDEARAARGGGQDWAYAGATSL